jgi:hypothetical protein
VLGSLTADDFRRRIGDTYRLFRPGEPVAVDLVLTTVTQYPGSVGSVRQPFSLEFAGPPGPALPQHIYRLEHDRDVPLDMFLVPLGPDAGTGAMTYEAAFS